jgi:hypothetical protein
MRNQNIDLLPKLWYGWFGRGTKMAEILIVGKFKNLLKNFTKKIYETNF